MSFLPNQPFRPFRPGEGKRSVFDSTRQNQAMDAIKRINRDLQRQLATQPVKWNITEIFLGKIVSADYISETYDVDVDDQTDARYWVERQRIPETFEEDDLVETDVDDRASDETVFVNATNLSETAAGSHGLEEDGDGIYLVFGITVEAREQKQVKAYYFQSGGGGDPIYTKITADATKDGTYQCITGSFDFAGFNPTAAGTLSISAYFTGDAVSYNAYFVNLSEVGVAGSHDLDADEFAIGWQVGTYTSGATDYPLIFGFKIWSGACS